MNKNESNFMGLSDRAVSSIMITVGLIGLITIFTGLI